MPLPQLAPTTIGISQLSQRWLLQVDTAFSNTAPAWVPVFGQKSFGYTIASSTVDNSTSDTGIWGSKFTVGLAWTATAKLEHELFNGAEDPGQAFLRQAGSPTGANALPKLVHLRFFDRFGGPEVFEGWANVSWAPDIAEKDTEKITVTFDGQNALFGVGDTLPGGGTLASPIATNSKAVLISASPAAQTAGKIVTIHGANFTGATAVSFNNVAVAAGAFNVESDSVIAAVVPAGSAGTGDIRVTNSVGVSDPLIYTRGA
jgi:hypothetical protein